MTLEVIIIGFVVLTAAVAATVVYLIARNRKNMIADADELLRYVNNKEIPVVNGQFDPNAMIEGEPLIIAILKDKSLRFVDKIDWVSRLLKAGADPNARDKDGTPALISIFSDGLLIEKLLPLFLEHGADPNAMDASGKTSLCYAGIGQELELLLEHGADPNVVDIHGTPLMILAAQEKYAGSTVARLCRVGVNPNACDAEGKTALFYVNDRSTMESLIRNGAFLHAEDNAGETALFYAMKAQKYNVVNGFEQEGCLLSEDLIARSGFNRKAYEMTLALEKALECGDEDAAVHALENGADPRYRVGGGAYGTVLEVAADKGYPKIVRALVKHGAEIDLWVCNAAICSDRPECLETLLELGANPKLCRIAINTYGSPRIKEVFNKYAKTPV